MANSKVSKVKVLTVEEHDRLIEELNSDSISDVRRTVITNQLMLNRRELMKQYEETQKELNKLTAEHEELEKLNKQLQEIADSIPADTQPFKIPKRNQ